MGRDEHSLEYHQIYREYLDIFEAKIEKFVVDSGSSIGEFQRLGAAALKDPDCPFERSFFIEVKLAPARWIEQPFRQCRYQCVPLI